MKKIKEINLNELHKHKMGVYKAILTKKYAYYPNQKYWYFIFNKGNKIEGNGIELKKLPEGIHIQHTGKKIRLWGYGCGLNGVGVWANI